jgi:hypothetical protein
MSQINSIWSYKNNIHRNYYNWVGGTIVSGYQTVEGGDKRNRWVEITLDGNTLPAIAGGANLAVGNLIYTLPPGEILVRSAYMSVALTAADGNIDDDTPDVGLGTVIGSGAVAVLGGTATFENIITGQTATDCSGTATVATVSLDTALEIATAGAHTVHLNVADGWAADGEAACPISGLVVLEYKVMS